MSKGMDLRRYMANYPTTREEGHVPLLEFARTIEWLHEADVTMTGVDEG